mmetsp:Transcript_4085/g.5925  ORF Transcript_4085/g.5925 Transcript_4085/m.5925 type:complete len:83 (+) Transcript_4085:212-460(+)
MNLNEAPRTLSNDSEFNRITNPINSIGKFIDEQAVQSAKQPKLRHNPTNRGRKTNPARSSYRRRADHEIQQQDTYSAPSQLQ